MNPSALDDFAGEMKRAEVAAGAGMSASGLSQLASGASRASGATIARLASFLGCTPETLFPELAGFGTPEVNGDE